jgi:hypothetical protein
MLVGFDRSYVDMCDILEGLAEFRNGREASDGSGGYSECDIRDTACLYGSGLLCAAGSAAGNGEEALR